MEGNVIWNKPGVFFKVFYWVQRSGWVFWGLLVFGTVWVQVCEFSVDGYHEEMVQAPLLYLRGVTQRSHPGGCREAGHLRQREGEAGHFGKGNAR